MELGETIGGYEIVARLRSGGMANLLLGRRRGAAGFSRPVVIKVIHPHLASDEDFVNMFVDEAKISARIDHPNVVHVEQLGEEGGTFFLVMEYVHGVSLGELSKALRKKGRALSPALAVAIAINVADGLHGAHETRDDTGELLHIVHRDVSPQNVLISYRGHVKLIDFGVAKARGRSTQTQGGSLKGKIRYMSPQQAFGEHIDRRADVYSLGIVLWEILTQRNLFRAENELALLEMVRSPDIIPPSHYNAAVTPTLDDVVMRALSASPAGRPPTCLAFREALEGAVPGAAGLPASEIAQIVAAATGEKVRERADKLRRRLPGLDIQQSGSQHALTDTQVSKVLAHLTIDVEGGRSGSDPPSYPSGPSSPSRTSWPSATPPPVSASVSSPMSSASSRKRGVSVWAAFVLIPLAILGGVAFVLLQGGSDTAEPSTDPRASASQPIEDPLLTPRPPTLALLADDVTLDAGNRDAEADDIEADTGVDANPSSDTAMTSSAPAPRMFRAMRMSMRPSGMMASGMVEIPLAGEDDF